MPSASSWIAVWTICSGVWKRPGVDDLHARVSQGPGDHLGAAVVPVETGLRHDDAKRSFGRHAISLRRGAGRCPAWGSGRGPRCYHVPIVDQDVRDAIERDGYAVVAAILAPEEVARMRATLAGLLDAARGDATLRRGGTLHLEDVREVADIRGGVAIAERARRRCAASWGRRRASSGCIIAAHNRASAPRPCMPTGRSRSLRAGALGDGDRGVGRLHRDGGATRVVPGSHRLPRLAVPADPSVAFPRRTHRDVRGRRGHRLRRSPAARRNSQPVERPPRLAADHLRALGRATRVQSTTSTCTASPAA